MRLLLVLLPALAQAQTPRLVSDLTPAGSPASSSVVPLGRLGTRFLFGADGLNEGAFELRATDGTAAGTTLVSTLGPGRPRLDWSTDPLFTATKMFFVSEGGSQGVNVWVTDGTNAGTRLLRDFNPNRTGQRPVLLGVLGGLAWFAVDTPNGWQIWKSDGTDVGTQALLSPAIYYGTPQGRAVMMNGDLYFSALSGLPNASQLFRLTAAGVLTQLTFAMRSVSLMPNGVYGTTLFFLGNDGTTGQEPWRSDGTVPGTTLIKDINLTGDSNPTEMTAGINFVYFSATDTGSNTELWRSDGTTVGTTLFRDIEVGPGASYPSDFALFNGQTYFVATTTAAGRELWRTNGTASGVYHEFAAGAVSGRPRLLAQTPGALFFSAEDGVSPNVTIWSLDTTGTFTQLGSVQRGLYGAVADGTSVYFEGYTPANGYALWSSDGTATGTRLVIDLVPDLGDSSFGRGVSTPSGLRVVSAANRFYEADTTGVRRLADLPSGFGGGIVSFGATQLISARPIGNYDLYTVDGTDAGIRRITTNISQDLWSWAGGAAFVRTAALWVSDGVDAGAVASASAIGMYSNTTMAGVGNAVLVIAGTSTVRQEVYRVDTAGTLTQLTDFGHTGPGFQPGALVADGVTAWFFAADAASRELWKSDGTVAGTVRVAPISNDGLPGQAVTHEGKLYWLQREAEQTRLWASGGTTGTTAPVLLVPDDTSWLFSAGHALLYDGWSDATGTELFAFYDGLTAQLVADLEPGPVASRPARPMLHAGHAYFEARTSTSGRELWVIDIDTTPPTVTPVVTGSMGTNGFYTSNAQVTFTVTDAESLTLSGSACVGGMVTQDTPGDWFACVAHSMGGIASAMVTVKRDATAPVLVCSPDVTLLEGESLGTGGAAFDALDPAPVLSSSPDAGTVLGLGETVVTLSATDQAGNTATCSYSATVIRAPGMCVHNVDCAMGQQCLDGRCQAIDETPMQRSGCGCDAAAAAPLLLALAALLKGRSFGRPRRRSR